MPGGFYGLPCGDSRLSVHSHFRPVIQGKLPENWIGIGSLGITGAGGGVPNPNRAVLRVILME